MNSTVHKIPTGVKTFNRGGKYVMPWSVKELNTAVKEYLKMGGFTHRDDKFKFDQFQKAILRVNSSRSKDSMYMVLFNIARCDKFITENTHYNLYGGAGHLLLKVLRKMDPNQVRFTQNPL
jgi:hypothetical protein